MIVFPGCKINLGLNVTGKRPDGYHDLETCFYPVKWCDALEAIPAASFNLHVSGANLSGGPDNICHKAWKLLHERNGVPPVEAWLHKAIPHGAGLGGGSSDGAAMLNMLNQLFSLGLGISELEALALELGSDCPFFIQPIPRLATGKGEVFSPVDLSLSGMTITLIKPEGSIPTGEAYRHVKIGPPPVPLKTVLETIPVEEWKGKLTNAFEPYAFSVIPELPGIISGLYEAGAAYASMSGSGSAVFGLFRKPVDVSDLAEGRTHWTGLLD